MLFPHEYCPLTAEEMTYTSGGTALDAFNYLFGDWFRDLLLGDIRNATWNSLKQVSVQPAIDTGKNILSWSILAQAAYVYGFFRLAETVKGYLDK